jgi:tryptophan synthase beta chain
VIGCVGGGSNFSGFAFPFLHQNFTAGRTTRVIAAEPAACPSLTKGVYTFDYGDTAEMAPIVKMHTLGHSFVPPGIHAGGLRYHGMAPHVCALYDHGDIEAVAVPQKATFEAAVQFARAEGILPAPESAHAIRVAIDEALRCKAEGVSRMVAFNLSGHGHFDLAAYDEFLHGRLEDFAYPEEQIRPGVHPRRGCRSRGSKVGLRPWPSGDPRDLQDLPRPSPFGEARKPYAEIPTHSSFFWCSCWG